MENKRLEILLVIDDLKKLWPFKSEAHVSQYFSWVMSQPEVEHGSNSLYLSDPTIRIKTHDDLEVNPECLLPSAMP